MEQTLNLQTAKGGWRRITIGKLKFSWKFGRTTLGYHSMGDSDGMAGLGFATVWWVWLTY